MAKYKPGYCKRKQKTHLTMARAYLKHLTKENKEKDPEQYHSDLMSCTSLAQQAHWFLPSYKTEKLLKLLETK